MAATLRDAHPITAICCHPCEEFLYVGTSHKVVRLYDLETQRAYASLKTNAHHNAAVNALCITADGGVLVSASEDGNIHVRQRAKGC